MGISIYKENGKPIWRLHSNLFKEKTKDGFKFVERFYCDGLEKKLKRGDPLYGIGFEYLCVNDPITDWVDDEEEAVSEWKRLKRKITNGNDNTDTTVS